MPDTVSRLLDASADLAELAAILDHHRLTASYVTDCGITARIQCDTADEFDAASKALRKDAPAGSCRPHTGHFARTLQRRFCEGVAVFLSGPLRPHDEAAIHARVAAFVDLDGDPDEHMYQPDQFGRNPL